MIDALGLDTHPEFAPPPPSGSSPAAEAAPGLESKRVDTFLAQLHVKSEPNVHLVHVSFESGDPELAAEVSNTLARLYIDFNLEMRFAALQDALVWLHKQVDGMRQRVEVSERALQQYANDRDIYALENRLLGVMEEITQLGARLTEAKAERIELETLYKETRRAAAQGKSMEGTPAVVENRLIQSLKSVHADLLRTRTQLGQKYGEEHPRVLQVNAQSRALATEIHTEVKKVIQAVQTKYQAVKAREDVIVERLQTLQNEVKWLNTDAVQYGVLKREAESNRRLADVLLQRLKEASMSSDLTSGNNIRIIDAAEVPIRPINIRPKLTLGLGAMLGLLAGVCLASLMGYLDNTLETPEEAEEALGLPVVGMIERFPLRRHVKGTATVPLIALVSPRSAVTEAFKTLRANLLLSSTDSPRQVFLVTSPYPHEGKTTVAANLAMVMAQMERRVLLLDADLRHSSIHKAFHVHGVPVPVTC